jgi:hypothetical protein
MAPPAAGTAGGEAPEHRQDGLGGVGGVGGRLEQPELAAVRERVPGVAWPRAVEPLRRRFAYSTIDPPLKILSGA